MLRARLLPPGKRRATLEAALHATFDEDFAGRILPFDNAAVQAYVDIVSTRLVLRGRQLRSSMRRSLRSLATRVPGSRLATLPTSKIAE